MRYNESNVEESVKKDAEKVKEKGKERKVPLSKPGSVNTDSEALRNARKGMQWLR